jgi:hypothetical protein
MTARRRGVVPAFPYFLAHLCMLCRLLIRKKIAALNFLQGRLCALD